MIRNLETPDTLYAALEAGRRVAIYRKCDGGWRMLARRTPSRAWVESMERYAVVDNEEDLAKLPILY